MLDLRSKSKGPVESYEKQLNLCPPAAKQPRNESQESLKPLVAGKNLKGMQGTSHLQNPNASLGR